jgi:hypothetical protein
MKTKHVTLVALTLTAFASTPASTQTPEVERT